jgi:hypothetical protein
MYSIIATTECAVHEPSASWSSTGGHHERFS